MTRTIRKPEDHPNHRSGKRGPNGRPCCRRCGEEVPPRRRAWCSQECVDEWRAAWFWPSIRLAAWQRDGGTCQACLLDVELLHRIRRRLWERLGSFHGEKVAAWWLGLFGIPRTRVFSDLWDADHEKPLEEGGSNQLRNVRVLCIACHAAKTAQEARTRANRRRMERHRAALRAQGIEP